MSDVRAFQINRYPRGLIPLLDSKAEGTTPHVMSPVVQPGLDLGRFYDLSVPLAARGTTATTMTGSGGVYYGTAGVTVPVNEVWKVTAAGMYQPALAAGTTYKVSLLLRMLSLDPVSLLIPLSVPTTFVAGENMALGWSGEIWLGAGDVLGIVCHTFVAGTAVGPNLYMTGNRYQI